MPSLSITLVTNQDGPLLTWPADNSRRRTYVIAMESVQSRIRSIQEAEKGRSPGAVGSITRYIGDPHPRVRREAAIALGKMKDPEGIASLTLALSDSDRDVREAALAGIQRTGARSAEPAVIKLLGDKDPGIRIGALSVLSGIGTVRSVDAIAGMADEPFSDVREAAERALTVIRKRTGS